MTSVLFILTGILVVYIVYMMMTSSGTTIPSYKPVEKPNKASTKPSSNRKTPPKPAAKPAAKPAPKSAPKAVARPKPQQKPAKQEVEVSTSGFQHPKTGEKAANPTNYRFSKRWMKDAMVSEGLLDRVYKNNELNDPRIGKRVKEALERFKAIKKYHAK